MAEPFSTPTPILQLSSGLSIRPLLHTDAATVASQANNLKISRNMTERFPYPYTLDNAHAFITLVRDPKLWRPLHAPPDPSNIPAERVREIADGTRAPVHWAIALDGEFIGNLGFEFGGDVEACTAKFGYWLGEEYWGKGYATQVMRAAVAWAWQVYPEMKRVEATVHAWNPASEGVLRKVGFVEEGRLRGAVSKMGRTCDLVVYGMVREGLEVADVAPGEGAS